MFAARRVGLDTGPRGGSEIRVGLLAMAGNVLKSLAFGSAVQSLDFI